MSDRKLRVLLVDDHESWCDLFSMTLQKRSDLEVIAQAADGLEAVRKAQEQQPDLILLDIGLPSLNGIEAARRIREVSPMSKILFVSADRSTEIVVEALSTGAAGYLAKLDAFDLSNAVEAVLQGKRYLSTSLDGKDLGALDAEASNVGDDVKYNPYLRLGRSASLSKFLASVIEATESDFGNVQAFDSANRVLRIVVHRGFEREFLDYFATVNCDDHCVCGQAMRGRSRIVVSDVTTDSLFSCDVRSVLMRANVRSVQSTPLFDPSGRFVGMVSTHRRDSGAPTPQQLKQVDNLADSFLESLK